VATEDRPPHPDREVIPEPLKARLLERASELDARSYGSSIEDLRTAAREAGISERAFEAALAEMSATRSQRAEIPALRRQGRVGKFIVAFFAGGLLLFWLGRMIVPAPTATSATTASGTYFAETYVLSCLRPAEAADLVRPLLRDPANTIQASGDATNRVLTVGATASQHAEVKRLLDTQQAPGSPACAAPPPSPTPRPQP
jgi:hypothetical protein